MKNSKRTESTLTSFVAASPAKTLVRQESDSGSMAQDLGYGASLPDWFRKLTPDGSSWRTYRICVRSDSKRCSPTWPRSGLMRNGTVSPLPPLVPHTVGIGSGYWPTPSAADGWNLRFSTKACYRNLMRGHQPHITHLMKLLGLDISAFPRIYEWAMGYELDWTKLARE